MVFVNLLKILFKIVKYMMMMVYLVKYVMKYIHIYQMIDVKLVLLIIVYNIILLKINV